ncbi:MAG: hypothetical protein JWP35_1796 [Caulobacter sp.]|nr:hypothetical protein [Caulobacter sp.]
MASKTPATERWGGPGASHENATKPQPEKRDPRAPGEPTNTRHSHVSGGGGERDIHHGHDTHAKKDFEENATQRAKP